MILHNYIFT